MIHESYPWKKELRRLRKVLTKLSCETIDDDLDDYRIEKPLLQSAIIVRRLIESWKVTDAARELQFAVESFASLPNRQNVLARLTFQGDLDKEFDLSAANNVTMNAWNLTSELIHSGFINWEVDEQDRRFTAIYLASKRNHAQRLLRVTLDTYLSLLDAINDDRVNQVVSKVGANGALRIEIS